MSAQNIEKNKQEFVETYQKYIKREGSDKLLDWLLKSDFFTAPASTKFHSAFAGGLCFHSLNAFKRFLKNLQAEYGEDFENKYPMETIAICGLLHDVCKVHYYKEDSRNVKNETTGQWEKQPYFSVCDQLPFGHGEKSVYMLSGFMRLSRDEAMVINWHMGGFDARVQGGSYAMGEAFYRYPIALIFHISDLQATYLDETQENK